MRSTCAGIYSEVPSHWKRTIVTGRKSRNSSDFRLELKALFDTFSLEKKYGTYESKAGSSGFRVAGFSEMRWNDEKTTESSLYPDR